MNYTIAIMQEMSSGDEIRLVKNGNKYYLEFFPLNRAGKQLVRRHFNDIGEAVKLFQKFAGAFAEGCYSYEDRASWLAE